MLQAEIASKLYSLSLCDHLSVTWGNKHTSGCPGFLTSKITAWSEFKSKHHSLPPSLMSRQSRKTNLFGYLPPLVWFRGLSLSEVHIIDAGLCPLPFPFSFLLKHSVWWQPRKDKSLWTTALFQGCACFAAFPRESSMTAEWTKERTSPLSFGCQDSPQHTHPRVDNWLQTTLLWSRS